MLDCLDQQHNPHLMEPTQKTPLLYSVPGYSGHVYSGHSDIVATFSGTKYIYSIIFRSDIVANRYTG